MKIPLIGVNEGQQMNLPSQKREMLRTPCKAKGIPQLAKDKHPKPEGNFLQGYCRFTDRVLGPVLLPSLSPLMVILSTVSRAVKERITFILTFILTMN